MWFMLDTFLCPPEISASCGRIMVSEWLVDNCSAVGEWGNRKASVEWHRSHIILVCIKVLSFGIQTRNMQWNWKDKETSEIEFIIREESKISEL
jgi:hypothetical protein